MQYRHEWKIEISYGDLLILRRRLRAVAKSDPHAVDGHYFIRSLYFDTPENTALWEKIDGVNRREKYRIRYYNGDPTVIHLEKKGKLNGLCSKESAAVTAGQVQELLNGNTAWMAESQNAVIREFYSKYRTQNLRPKTIVDYTREPFIYEPGNVRVTFDYNIRTGILCTDFLNPDCVTVPAGETPILMEVKWDAFLPDVIRDAVQIPGRRAGAFSKYAQCRIYG